VLAAGSLEAAESEEAVRRGRRGGERGRQAAGRRAAEEPELLRLRGHPKHKTLEVFGRNGEDGRPRPSHLYSMRQAIEGFILDVLANCATYKTYYPAWPRPPAANPEVDRKPHTSRSPGS
jgi:type I restriction enzyme R subunit